ncbi:transcriptional repressor [Candidatus Woesearchaeota archaeon]|nr:transcriptional repressor [Candidatus Woesearchaeota archaeon]
MRTDLIYFILSSENRKKIIKTIFESSKKQWSCSFIEEATKISHSTVFRTLINLKELRILKSVRINKKDSIYELSIEPELLKELERFTKTKRGVR